MYWGNIGYNIDPILFPMLTQYCTNVGCYKGSVFDGSAFDTKRPDLINSVRSSRLQFRIPEPTTKASTAVHCVQWRTTATVDQCMTWAIRPPAYRHTAIYEVNQYFSGSPHLHSPIGLHTPAKDRLSLVPCHVYLCMRRKFTLLPRDATQNAVTP